MVMPSIKEIKTLQDAKNFIFEMNHLDIDYHYDDGADDIMKCGSDELLFTPDEAKHINALVAQARDICDKNQTDIFHFAIMAQEIAWARGWLERYKDASALSGGHLPTIVNELAEFLKDREYPAHINHETLLHFLEKKTDEKQT